MISSQLARGENNDEKKVVSNQDGQRKGKDAQIDFIKMNPNGRLLMEQKRQKSFLSHNNKRSETFRSYKKKRSKRWWHRRKVNRKENVLIRVCYVCLQFFCFRIICKVFPVFNFNFDVRSSGNSFDNTHTHTPNMYIGCSAPDLIQFFISRRDTPSQWTTCKNNFWISAKKEARNDKELKKKWEKSSKEVPTQSHFNTPQHTSLSRLTIWQKESEWVRRYSKRIYINLVFIAMTLIWQVRGKSLAQA